LGFGALLRRQLKRFGVDLDDQTRNQKLAGSALVTGLATIDLSSASDTVCRELVWLLLPFEWASLLDLARSEYAEVEGKELKLEKFSSMGNGFTFELETLVFYALALAAAGTRKGVNAYGDDIILPRAKAPILIETLNFLGFDVNTQKTFLAGRFFESCGMDFFDGFNVRPFFWKGQRDQHSVVIYTMMNSIRRYANMRLRTGWGCDVRFLPAWLYLRAQLSIGDRNIHIPPGYGDGGIVSNFDESTPKKARHGIEGYISRCYVNISKKRNSEPLGLLIAQLVRLPTSASYGVEPIRGYQRYCKHPVLFPNWTSLGPWL